MSGRVPGTILNDIGTEIVGSLGMRRFDKTLVQSENWLRFMDLMVYCAVSNNMHNTIPTAYSIPDAESRFTYDIHGAMQTLLKRLINP